MTNKIVVSYFLRLYDFLNVCVRFFRLKIYSTNVI